MTSITMGLPAGYECTSGGRDVAREGFLRHLRGQNARVLQDIVDSDLGASNVHDSTRLHDLKIQRARVLQGIVASNQCGSALRRQMRREKIRRDRYRRYFAKENLNSSNLDLKIRRAHARQKLVDIDLRCGGLRGSGG